MSNVIFVVFLSVYQSISEIVCMCATYYFPEGNIEIIINYIMGNNSLIVCHAQTWLRIYVLQCMYVNPL